MTYTQQIGIAMAFQREILGIIETMERTLNERYIPWETNSVTDLLRLLEPDHPFLKHVDSKNAWKNNIEKRSSVLGT